MGVFLLDEDPNCLSIVILDGFTNYLPDKTSDVLIATKLCWCVDILDDVDFLTINNDV